MLNIITLFSIPLFVAGPAAAPPARPAPPDSSDMTLVVVQNERKVPVTIYAQNDVSEYKLGVVEPGGSATMRIASYIVDRGDIQFFVQPTKGFEESSGLIEMHRGQRLGLVIPPR